MPPKIHNSHWISNNAISPNLNQLGLFVVAHTTTPERNKMFTVVCANCGANLNGELADFANGELVCIDCHAKA